jgi:transposase-like protein
MDLCALIAAALRGHTSSKVRRIGLACGSVDCREQFTVTVGTPFERSKVPLSKWLMAAYLLCSSRKGISARQLQSTLGLTYKTAWRMAHGASNP